MLAGMSRSAAKTAKRPVKTGRGKRDSKARQEVEQSAEDFLITEGNLPTGWPAKVKAVLRDLSRQEQKFVMAYVGRARGNATLAFELATGSTNYAGNSSQGSVYLQRARVRNAIDTWYEAYGVSAAQLTAQIADMASVNMGPFTKYDPKTKSLKLRIQTSEDWESHKHWVKRVKIDPETGRVTDIELHDSMVARRELAKILKLYSDAPVFALHVHLRGLSDDQLRDLWQQRQVEGPRIMGRTDEAALRGEPIAVIESTTEKGK